MGIAWGRVLDRFQNGLVNPFVGRLLRSPLHDLLSHRVVLLTVTGRRSGAAIRIPAMYERHGDVLTLISREWRLWWRNLDGGAPVRLVLDGVERDGFGTVARDRAGVMAGARGAAMGRAPADPVVVTVRLTAEPPRALPRADRRLWWRWLGAVTVGEIVAFSVPAVTGAVLAGSGTGPLAQGALIVAAGAVEGTVLGLAQAYALRSALPAVATRDWVRATAAGAAIAWVIGAFPVVLGERFFAWPPALLVVLGLALLAAMGLLQWRVLAPHVRGALGWVPATAASWLVALGAFALVTTPLWRAGQPTWLIIAIGLLGGAVMAVTVAGLTGAALVRLLHRRDTRPAGTASVHARVRGSR